MTFHWVRIVETVVWICTAAMGIVAISELLRVTITTPLFALQSAPLVSLGASLPFAIGAVATGRVALAIVNACVVVALVWLTAPAIGRRRTIVSPTGAPTMTIAFANTFYENVTTDDTACALLALDADVLSMAEYTPGMEASLRRAGAFDRYPFVVGQTDVTRDGIVVLSRRPFVRGAHCDIGDVPGVDVTVDVDGAPVRVLVVHPVAPVGTYAVSSWRNDLRFYRTIVDETVRSGGATVIVGDFNASRGHPDFRALIDRSGFRSAHEWLGAGLSLSWPIDGRLPTFVRIDHALVHDVVPLAVRDLDTPGSDHRAFLLTIAAGPR